MSEKVLDKLAARFEALGKVHGDIVEQLMGPALLTGHMNKAAVDKHAILTHVYKELAVQLRGTIADLKNNV